MMFTLMLTPGSGECVLTRTSRRSREGLFAEVTGAHTDVYGAHGPVCSRSCASLRGTVRALAAGGRHA